MRPLISFFILSLYAFSLSAQGTGASSRSVQKDSIPPLFKNSAQQAVAFGYYPPVDTDVRTLILKRDSSFEYEAYGCFYNHYTVGTWKLRGDTVMLNTSPSLVGPVEVLGRETYYQPGQAGILIEIQETANRKAPYRPYKGISVRLVADETILDSCFTDADGKCVLNPAPQVITDTADTHGKPASKSRAYDLYVESSKILSINKSDSMNMIALTVQRNLNFYFREARWVLTQNGILQLPVEGKYGKTLFKRLEE